MTRYHATPQGNIPFTAEEEAARDAAEAAWAAGADDREAEEVRIKRDALLSETDWMANSDVTMSDEWRTYRQALRDLPSTATPTLDSTYELDMTSVTWPTEPS